MKLRILILLICLSIFNLFYIKPNTKENEETIEVFEVKEKIKEPLTVIIEGKYIIKSVDFKPNNLIETSRITYDDMRKLLKGTGLEDVSNYIVQCELEYGINALFLTGLIALESGWGKSDRAKETNNLGGVAVYTPLSRGSIYSSRGESVNHIAQFLAEDYLKEDGKYYNGKSIWNVNIKYCVEESWSNKIINIANEMVDRFNKM